MASARIGRSAISGQHSSRSHLETDCAVIPNKFANSFCVICIFDNETMIFETTEGEMMLKLQDIMYFEGEKNYYTIKMFSDKTYRCRGTMSSVEERISKYDFFRVHSAFIINEEHIQSIHNEGYLKMKNGVVINISRRKMQAFRESYMQFTRRRFAK